MNDALRRLAELHLLGRLVSDRYEVSTQDERSSTVGPGVPQRAARFAEHVEALRAIGVLSDPDARAWDARFASEVNAAVEAPATCKAGSSERLHRLLDEHLDSSARRRTGGSTRREISPFEHALHALRNCGAISRAEYARWYERFLTHPELPAEVREALRAAQADRRAAQQPRPTYAALKRVIIGPQLRWATSRSRTPSCIRTGRGCFGSVASPRSAAG